MVIALYIIHVWETLQAAWESRNCNALIYPPLYFDEFFIHNFFILAQLRSCFLHQKVKTLDQKWWHVTNIQNTFMLFLFIVFLAVFDQSLSPPPPPHSCTKTRTEPWLIVTVIWPWTAVVVKMHSNQQVALPLPFSSETRANMIHIIALFYDLPSCKSLSNVQWYLIMHVEENITSRYVFETKIWYITAFFKGLLTVKI